MRRYHSGAARRKSSTPTDAGNCPLGRLVRAGAPPLSRGETTTAGAVSRAEHPHVRGAYDVVGLRDAGVQGTPPRTWGLHPRPRRSSASCRNTPTYVGLTPTVPATRSTTGEHPHVRGAYVTIRLIERTVLGTPPRTWGLPWVDPFAVIGRGTPPRTWGLPRGGHEESAPRGNTPTYVGNQPCGAGLILDEAIEAGCTSLHLLTCTVTRACSCSRSLYTPATELVNDRRP